MYLSHFGLNEPPFRITPHTDFFFAGASRGATLDALLYAITHDEGIVKVSGEVGSGKTMLCRVLMERLPENIETIYLANPSLSREEILFAIADELKLELTAERATRLLRELQDHLIKLFGAGRRVVVLIDEAHAMPKDTLEEIRLLSNLETGRQKLLQIVLFGQPELDEHLGTADMRQLKERITHSFHLEPMVRSDIDSYIDFRMRAAGYRGPNVFSPKAIRLIAAASEGLTRRINILADKSLLAAFAHNTHGVTEKEARAAIRDSDFFKPRLRSAKYWLAGAAMGAGAAIGWSVHWLASSPASGTLAPLPAISSAAAPSPPSFSTIAEPASAAPKEPAVTGGQAVLAEPNSRNEAVPSGPVLRTGALKALSPTVEDRPAPADTAMGKMTHERFEATQEWLKSAPGNYYAVQLLTVKASESKRMEDFLLKAAKFVSPEDLHVYSVKIDGLQHYRVALGAYTSAGEIQSVIKELPPLFKAQNPYLRSIDRMRSQNRQ
jgi:MSHA biogenesis protein MshM